MYVRKMKKDAVSPVIAVILMVAITVVLAGVLYVWVTSLADTSSTTTKTLGVSVTDAGLSARQLNTGTAADDTTFQVGEEMIAVHHDTGQMINWTVLTKIVVTKVGSDTPYQLVVLKIAGNAYKAAPPAPNCVSTVGDTVILGLKNIADTGKIAAGTYLILQISGSSYNYKSSSSGFIVN